MSSSIGAHLDRMVRALIAPWVASAERVSPVALIVIVWAVLVLPLMITRGFNSDEGLAVTLARTAIEEGRWVEPHMFNVRWVERPALLSWIIAAISWPFGAVTQVTARLPVVACVLAGALLVFHVTRRYNGPAAALVAAGLFLFSPIVVQAYVMTTADLPLAVLLFAAFAVWRAGDARGGVSLRRWVALGGLLALAGLLKGPQPLAFFFIGIGCFLLVTRGFAQIPGLILCGILAAIPTLGWYAAVFSSGDTSNWLRFMRLSSALSAPLPGPAVAFVQTLLAFLPAVLGAGAVLLTRPWTVATPPGPRRDLLALACFAFPCAVIVLFWPGGATPRYFLPMLPALCVMGGYAFEALRAARPALIAPALATAMGVAVYATGYVAASPFLPREFRQTALDGARINEIVRAAPAPFYRVNSAGLNIVPYVPGRVTDVSLDEALRLRGLAYVLAMREDAAVLLRDRPGVTSAADLGRRAEFTLLVLRP